MNSNVRSWLVKNAAKKSLTVKLAGAFDGARLSIKGAVDEITVREITLLAAAQGASVSEKVELAGKDVSQRFTLEGELAEVFVESALTDDDTMGEETAPPVKKTKKSKSEERGAGGADPALTNGSNGETK